MADPKQPTTPTTMPGNSNRRHRLTEKADEKAHGGVHGETDRHHRHSHDADTIDDDRMKPRRAS